MSNSVWTHRRQPTMLPPSLGFSRQEHWSGLPFPSPNREKWKVKVQSLSRVRLLVTPWTAAHQAPPSMGFSRQEYWSGVPLPSPIPSLYTCKVSIYLMSLEMSLKAYKKWNIYSRKSAKTWRRQWQSVTLQPWPISFFPPPPPLPLGAGKVTLRAPSPPRSRPKWHLPERSGHQWFSSHPATPSHLLQRVHSRWVKSVTQRFCCQNTRTSISLARLTCKVRVPRWKKRVKQIKGTLVTATAKTGLSSREMTPLPLPHPQSGGSEVFSGQRGKTKQLF